MNIKQTLLFTALAFGLGSAQAGIIVTDGTTLYSNSDNVFVPANTMANALFIRDTGTGDNDDRAGLQTFRWTGNNNYEIVGLNIIVSRLNEGATGLFRLIDFGESAPPTNFNRARLDDPGDDDFYPTLVSEIITISASQAYGGPGNDEDKTLTWNLPSTVSLQNNRFYGLDIVGQTVGQSIVWRTATNNPFANGMAYSKSESSSPTNYIAVSNNDFSLALVAVPEPGTLALLGIAGLALALTAKRRRG